MLGNRLEKLVRAYNDLRIAVVGDFCLDRYLEIDPAREEISIETGLPVHNVVRVRPQPGGAGTILNNLIALGVQHLFPVGFCGVDGEGHELQRALGARPGVSMDHFQVTPGRCTFTYTKPLQVRAGVPPRELNRLDQKNWTPTPVAVEEAITGSVSRLAGEVDAMILLEQVDHAGTGVLTAAVLNAVKAIVAQHPDLLVIADSRRGLRDYPPVCFKMNIDELRRLRDLGEDLSLETVKEEAVALAEANQQPVFVTLAEQGIVAAGFGGEVVHGACPPVRGEIDIVGAGDAVTANLTAALAAGGSLCEAVELANLAASVVIHQVGTTGTASPDQLLELAGKGNWTG